MLAHIAKRGLSAGIGYWGLSHEIKPSWVYLYYFHCLGCYAKAQLLHLVDQQVAIN